MLTATSRLLELPSVREARGDLAIVEGLSFTIAEAVWTAEPQRCAAVQAQRDALLVALVGSFQVVIQDGGESIGVTLGRPSQGLLVAARSPRCVDSVAPGSICLLVGGPRP